MCWSCEQGWTEAMHYGIRDWRQSSEALDNHPLKAVNLNKLGLQTGPQLVDKYGPDSGEWSLLNRVLDWFRDRRG